MSDLVNIGKNDKLMFSGDFNHTLHEISETVERTSKLITTQNLERASENLSLDEIDNVISDLANAQAMARDVEKGRRQLRKAFNVRRDLVVKQFDEKVNKAGYDKLARYHESAKELKRLVRQKRKTERLETIVKPMFNNLVKNYPLLNKLAPKLADSNNFVLNTPSIVGGGKKPANKSEIEAAISAYLDSIEANLTDLKTNIYQFDSNAQNAIFKAYTANPTNETYQNAVAQMLTYKNTKPDKQEAVKPDDVPNLYGWLVNYVTLNLNSYRNIRTDYKQRLALIEDLLTQYKNKRSFLWQTLLDKQDNQAFIMCNLIFNVFNIK